MPFSKKYASIRYAKGELIAAGATGVVERINDYQVLKSTWTTKDEELCRREIATEAEIYGLIGKHDRFLTFYGYDPVEGSIKLEYMRHGTLRDYLTNQDPTTINHRRRADWARQAAEGLDVLHSLDVIHCDLSPRNILLDENLDLKITDMACASLRGSLSHGGGDIRFRMPRRKLATTAQDIFALGSTIYEMITGRAPYADLETPRVLNLLRVRQLPDLLGIPMGDIILRCWLGRFRSPRSAMEAITSYVDKMPFPSNPLDTSTIHPISPT